MIRARTWSFLATECFETAKPIMATAAVLRVVSCALLGSCYLTRRRASGGGGIPLQFCLVHSPSQETSKN